MKTLKQFAEKSNLSATLIRAVVRQMGGWESFQQSADDVTNHGASCGFSGFCYYSETVPFAQRNFESIMDVARDMADQLGESGPIALITGFNCLKGENQESVADGLYNRKSDNKTTVYNALAWFALEEVCRAYSDITETA